MDGGYCQAARGANVKNLFCFGLGYTGMAVARRLRAQGWQVSGTTRDLADWGEGAPGIECVEFTGTGPMRDFAAAVAPATHLLVTIAPGPAGDPVLNCHGSDLLVHAEALERIAYLSTTAVYGDHEGAWIDETTPTAPASPRARQRVAAEDAWRDLAGRQGVALDIFRLSGIYGPGRNQLAAVRSGTAKRINKPGHVFNRIHVEDIATTIAAAFAGAAPGAIYNVADNEPAPPQQVVAFAAKLLGLEPPAEISFADAQMTPMARSFYGESKRVSNRAMVERLGVRLAYPTYREGLSALVQTLHQPGDA